MVILKEASLSTSEPYGQCFILIVQLTTLDDLFGAEKWKALYMYIVAPRFVFPGPLTVPPKFTS